MLLRNSDDLVVLIPDAPIVVLLDPVGVRLVFRHVRLRAYTCHSISLYNAQQCKIKRRLKRMQNT